MPRNQSSHSAKHVMWSDDMDNILTCVLVEQATLGNKGDNGWKSCALNTAKVTINEALGKDIGTFHIRSRLKTWRTQYIDIKEALGLSGFGWTSITKILEAPESVCKGFAQSKPHLRKYKHISIPNFNELAIIIGNDYAIGVGAGTSIEVDMDMTVVDNEAAHDEGLEAFPDDTDFQIPHSTSPSQSQQKQPSGSRRRKRTLHVDPEIAQIFGTMSSSLANLANAVQQRGRLDQQELSAVTNELKKLEGFDALLVIEATRFIISDPNLVSIFFYLSDDERKIWLINELRK